MAFWSGWRGGDGCLEGLFAGRARSHMFNCTLWERALPAKGPLAPPTHLKACACAALY